ncbi:hypothetical protein ABIE26_003554 [Pedobacter africanus]|uniref:Uncharacterized protein n=1 Tax=Pedobacter africanus TaxID=151894 RepID=A0ACC6L0Q0_9SPHI|nr:hypothetical protein [Pedobacter africanus]
MINLKRNQHKNVSMKFHTQTPLCFKENIPSQRSLIFMREQRLKNTATARTVYFLPRTIYFPDKRVLFSECHIM